MNELQVFDNPDFGEIRSLLIEGEPWFIGLDVASALGYVNNRKALTAHVDLEDKNTVTIRDGIPGNPNKVIINESGLYSLILSSKLPEAKKFKRWVTGEVLPSLRKYGAYALSDASQGRTDDETGQRVLTPDDYLSAARTIATCRNERLPYVLNLIEKSGIDLSGIGTAETACPLDLSGLEDFVSKPVPADWNRRGLEERLAYWRNGEGTVSTVPRQMITAVEIWRELLGQRGPLNRADARRINVTLEALPGWRRYPSALRAGPYGVQRGFIRE